MAETAIQWSATSGHLRVGIKYRWDDIGAGTATTHVYADLYAQSQSYGYADNQRCTVSGSASAVIDYYMSAPSSSTTTVYIGTIDLGVVATSYGGGPTFTLTAAISLAFDGSTPSKTASVSLPARPASAPSAPALPTVSAIGADRATAAWVAPSSNGSAITSYDVQTALDDAFTVGVATVNVTGSPVPLTKIITGLQPGTATRLRVRGVNAVGNGTWSATRTFTTLTAAWVKVAGAWQRAKVWVKVAGVWRLAKVWKKVDGEWVM